MFGVYDYSFQWEEERICLGIERKDNFLLYYRKSQEGSLEKIIGEKGGRLIINPVEPLNLPKEITPYLEFHFRPVVIQPDSKQTIFLKFPVEICVFLEANNTYNVLDIFSFSTPKYALYGNPDKGMITRHIETAVFDRIPELDPLVEGVMVLTIQNTSRTWVEVTRAVFENIDLNIFYGDFVAMEGRMEVFSQDLAETMTLKSPLQEDMKLAIPLFTARQILLPDKLTFLMEFGVGD
ncbi:MAG TPA: DUF432 domain-containing protein [Methanoregulaceae archaeon]|nr:DUF432 domain-containing protein [Methanoregulaceae archaeon]